jgi:hypothetical protein
MDATPPTPFDALEICFRLLSNGPACLALDGRRLGRGLPARQIPLGELRVLLQHPATTSDLQRAVLEELVRLATKERGSWVIALAGMLLPGLRRIVASVASVDHRAAGHVEADLLEMVRDVIGQDPSRAANLAVGVLQFTHLYPPSPGSMGRAYRLEA